MSEYIGSRISLISKSDIRYVGTLHEINSENSTVALENVTSFGTEGRRNGEDEIPASAAIYEYIVFRGSDVKDLRIEEPPKENKPPPPPQIPDDPAILGAARPPPLKAPGAPQQPNQRQQQPPNFQQPPPYPNPYGPYPPFQGQRFGPPGGFPGGPGGPGGFPGYPGMPYGAPPGWYPPPGQGFPQPPGPFSPPQPPRMPIGPPGQQNQQQPPQGPQGAQPTPIGPSVNKSEKQTTPEKVPEVEAPSKPVDGKPTSQTTTPAPAPSAAPKQAPPPPVESKPDVAAALAPAAASLIPTNSGPLAPKAPPTGPKSARVVPAVPLPSPGVKAAAQPAAPLQPAAGNSVQPSAAQPGQAAVNVALQYQNATQAATAAVAAAMAKLPPAPGQKAPAQQKQEPDSAIDNLTKKVNDMRTDDRIRHSKQPGTGGFAAGHRGSGGGRGGRARNQQSARPVDVPTTDYDFELANAKFNKQDMVKEAIATGSPLGTPGESGGTAVTNGVGDANGTAVAAKEEDGHAIPPPSAPGMYNKSTSFFDNISSELKDREEAQGRRLGGQEFRSEERKKNLETFGQGSVDNYRGGFRGRGRGRGFGRGRGGFGGRGRGNAGVRGGRGGSQTAEAGAA